MCVKERPCEDKAGQWPSAAQQGALRRKLTCQHLDPGLPASRTARNKFLLFKSPDFDVLLWPPEATNTLYLMVSVGQFSRVILAQERSLGPQAGSGGGCSLI